MAQQPHNTEDVIEFKTNHDPGFSFEYEWAVHSKPELDRARKETIFSKTISSDFEFNGEILSLLWCLEFRPKASLDKGTCKIVLSVEEMPKSKSMDIVSVKISQKTHVMGVRSTGTNVHSKDPNYSKFMGYFVIDDKHELKTESLLTDAGFDVQIRINIESIQFKHKQRKNMQNININDSNLMDFDKTRNGSVDAMLERLTTMQHDLNIMSKKINDLHQRKSNNDSQVIQNTKSQLEGFILDIFSNDETIGQEYVKLIIENEGFDDIDVFCKLKENDLKEIGINKKGHRMKILGGIEKYHKSKQQKQQESEYAKVGGHAMLDVEGTEGKHD